MRSLRVGFDDLVVNLYHFINKLNCSRYLPKQVKPIPRTKLIPLAGTGDILFELTATLTGKEKITLSFEGIN